jgi:hypothetical protein
VADFRSRPPFEEVASNWVRRYPVARQRRCQEMVRVLETMREMGVDPVIMRATTAFFERSGGPGLTEAFPEKPGFVDTVIEFLEREVEGRSAPLSVA